MDDKTYIEKKAGAVASILEGAGNLITSGKGKLVGAGEKLYNSGMSKAFDKQLETGVQKTAPNIAMRAGSTLKNNPGKVMAGAAGAVGAAGVGADVEHNKNASELYHDELIKQAGIIGKGLNKVTKGIQTAGIKLHDSGAKGMYERSTAGKGAGLFNKAKQSVGNTMIDHPDTVAAGTLLGGKAAVTGGLMAKGIAKHHKKKMEAEKVASADDKKKV